MKGTRVKTIKSKLGKKDILTEMFEHFGIKVIDVNNSGPKTKYRKECGALGKDNYPDFKLVEFDGFKNESGSNSFVLSPQKWGFLGSNSKHRRE